MGWQFVTDLYTQLQSLRAPAQRLWDEAQGASDKMAKCFTKGRTAKAHVYRNEVRAIQAPLC